MMKSFFTTLSYIFHPLFLPLLGLYFLFELPTKSFGFIDTSMYSLHPEIKESLYILIGFLAIVAPGLSLLIMYRSKLISSLTSLKKEDRTIPLVLMVIYYVLTYSLISTKLPANMYIPFLLPYIFGFTLTAIIALIFNFYIKISLHMIGFFGLIGAITGYFQNQMTYNLWFLLFLILVGGIIGSARLYLKAHTLKDLIYGIGFGFGIEYFCMKFEWFI